MTTDELILALVQPHGFKLPEGMDYDNTCHVFRTRGYTGLTRPAILEAKQAHDLCAMEFARQLVARGKDFLRDVAKWDEVLATRFRLMLYGDSAAAIKALYDAMEAK